MSPSRTAFHVALLPLRVNVPCIVLPLTFPVYWELPAVKLMRSPLSLPFVISIALVPDFSVPDIIWKL